MDYDSLPAPTDVPEGFFDIVAPFIGDEAEAITDELELIALWKTAFIYANDFPDTREDIAELIVAAVSPSPLVQTDGILQTIHILFKALRYADPNEADEDWEEVQSHVDDLTNELTE